MESLESDTISFAGDCIVAYNHSDDFTRYSLENLSKIDSAVEARPGVDSLVVQRGRRVRHQVQRGIPYCLPWHNGGGFVRVPSASRFFSACMQIGSAGAVLIRAAHPPAGDAGSRCGLSADELFSVSGVIFMVLQDAAGRDMRIDETSTGRSVPTTPSAPAKERAMTHGSGS